MDHFAHSWAWLGQHSSPTSPARPAVRPSRTSAGEVSDESWPDTPRKEQNDAKFINLAPRPPQNDHSGAHPGARMRFCVLSRGPNWVNLAYFSVKNRVLIPFLRRACETMADTKTVDAAVFLNAPITLAKQRVMLAFRCRSHRQSLSAYCDAGWLKKNMLGLKDGIKTHFNTEK